MSSFSIAVYNVKGVKNEYQGNKQSVRLTVFYCQEILSITRRVRALEAFSNVIALSLKKVSTSLFFGQKKRDKTSLTSASLYLSSRAFSGVMFLVIEIHSSQWRL